MAFSNALTDTKLQKAKPGNNAYTLTDGRGLYILIQPAGGKLWRYKYSFDGKPKLMALGSYLVVTLAMARERHMEARRQLSAGVDPMAMRREGKTAVKASADGAFANVAALWLDHWRLNKSPRHVDSTEHRLKADILPALGARHICEIQAKELIAMAKKIEGDRGARDVAKRAVETTGQIFEYAIANGLANVERNPARDVKPSLILKPVEVQHMARVDVKEELPALLRAIDTYKGLVTRLAMKLLALTFVRTSELIEAPWSEIDLDAARWTIPAERMKMKTPHIVPLSRQAIEILKALQQLTGHGDLLFPGDRDSERAMSNMTILAALWRLGYKGRMTGHGFRGIASTVLHEHEFKDAHIELQLAHQKRDKVAAAYNYAEHLKARGVMMQWYADYLDARRQGARVIPIAS